MLYVTTRSNRDAYTAQRVLGENRGPDGGLYVPFRLPKGQLPNLPQLKDQTFSATVAAVLNVLFNTQITAWDVEFSAGRYPVRLQQLGQRIIMAECWHNLDWRFTRTVRQLTALLRQDKSHSLQNCDWAEVGIRIAVLYGIFGELLRLGVADENRKTDISVVSGDFSAPMSAWYARAFGLPIGSIVCSCNDNGGLWDLIHHGQFRTDAVAVKTQTEEADIVVPTGLERLIHSCGGPEAVTNYVSAVRRGVGYYPENALQRRFSDGLFVSVVTGRRMSTTVRSVYSTDQYVISPYAALAYAGLQDFRSGTGETRHALILSEKSPVLDRMTVGQALGISDDALHKLLC